MYFQELIKQCDIEKVIKMFLSWCTDSPDIAKTEVGIRHVVDSLMNIEPDINENESLIVGYYEEGGYNFAYSSKNDDNEHYGLEMCPWKNVAGFLVDDTCLAAVGETEYVASTLWELTWLGFDEETIQHHFDENDKEKD